MSRHGRGSRWLLLLAVLACGPSPAPLPDDVQAEIVVVPTLGAEHQFDLDYTVAHLSALLDLISPDGIIVDDYTEWLQNECIWNLDLPENHVALAWAKEHSIPLLGTAVSPSDSAFIRAERTASEFGRDYPDIASIREGARRRLEETTARIAREYSFAREPKTLGHLTSVGFRQRASSWTRSQRDAVDRYATKLVDSIASRVTAHPEIDRWAVLLHWPVAERVAEQLSAAGGRVRPVESFLPGLDEAVRRRMDIKHVSWILAGQLDDWYGMWTPQAFNGARIEQHLGVLHELAPETPTSEYLEARWLLRNGDLVAAQSTLEELVETAGAETFPFPVVGKWLRPPWSSIRMKALLNLAFVYDLRGRRSDAVRIYRSLLADPHSLNREARAAGYFYDDIEWVVRRYLEVPYGGGPDEAFRHFRINAGVPPCAPSG